MFNKIKRRIYKLLKLRAKSEMPSCLTSHPSTVFLESTRFDIRVGESQFKGHISIGESTITGATFIFESDQGEISIGNNTFINNGTKFIARTKIVIGNYVTVAWGCTFYDHNSHSIDYRERQKDIQLQFFDHKNKSPSFISSKNWSTVKSRPITIEDNAWIGFDSVILSGVTIGEGAIVGARSVVRESVPPWTIVCGNPAVVVKKLEKPLRDSEK